ncbi:DUF1206 domain-containing protein [Actinocorallia populi]|uniref:DUF1206 domain-containing protein n=1 Tax=Actinocorallia populi TaxID=2079200 RepID=UPI000D08B26B|nr:DUF1206 domain-containing protein [Actinocorallia populi]
MVISPERQARQASQSKTMGLLARLGLAVRGVLYVLMGLLALQIAFGSGGEEADNSGAIQTLAAQPGGEFLLWLIVAGLGGLALWRLAEAAFGAAGPDGHKASERLMSLGRGVVYTALFVTTLLFTLGAGDQKSTDSQSKDLTAQAMQDIPGGRWLVLLAGLALIAGAAWMAWQAVAHKDFMDRLNVTGNAREVVEKLGMAGYTARSAVYVGIGAFLSYAAITFDAGKAKGIDGTLRELAGTPAGPWLLAVVALGLVLFGVYSCCEARWRRVTPG